MQLSYVIYVSNTYGFLQLVFFFGKGIFDFWVKALLCNKIYAQVMCPNVGISC